MEGYNDLREISIEEEDEVEQVWDYGCQINLPDDDPKEFLLV